MNLGSFRFMSPPKFSENAPMYDVDNVQFVMFHDVHMIEHAMIISIIFQDM